MGIRWDSSKCLRCGLCAGVCPVGAIRLECGGIVVDHGKCSGCGICVSACPVRALSVPGERK
ncbi:TPA: 4Fe-4S dicluster domain-containing protein [Candidatus Micrarchaeota archaeon]|nr:4Fe-4S dicluster domain-containing protein [Candidatus Micrarchaeota archaeon]